MDSVRIGYGKNLVEYDPQLPFYVRLPELKRMPGAPFEEARTAARDIYNKFKTQPTLCLSGGLDSECMALAFLAEGVPFKVATLVFPDGLNSHDTRHAISFCREHNIPQQLVELDVVNFYKSGEYRSYVTRYICHTPELAVQLWFLDQLKEKFVWAGEAFRIFPGNEPPAVQSVSEFEAVFYRYVQLNNLGSVPNFHFYSSELAWSFFNVSLKKKYKRIGEFDPEYYSEKEYFYRECGFPVRAVPERSLKLHGFEKVKIYFDDELRSSADTYKDRFRVPTANEFPLAKSAFVDFSKTDLFAKKILS